MRNEKLKNNVKQANAITLVSLVVTIIILIILAGITINMTIGESGIFTKAKQAKENFLLAANTEEELLRNVETSINTPTVGDDDKGETILKPEEYGQPVNYSANGVDDWQVFYTEEDETSPNYGNTYIITTGYLPNDLYPGIVEPSDETKSGVVYKSSKNEYYVGCSTKLGSLEDQSYALSPEDPNGIKEKFMFNYVHRFT